MEKKFFGEPYVQQRMVKSILANGGTADSRKLRILTGMKISQIYKGGTYLKSRGIIFRSSKNVTQDESIPGKISVYTLNPERMHDVHRLINQIPEGWHR